MFKSDKRFPTQSIWRRRLGLLRPFGPVIGPTGARDMICGAAGLGIVLLACAAVLLKIGAELSAGAFLIAPMGATAVILFAMPNSPLAQPWSAIVGNSVSALMALAVYHVVKDPALAIGASAFLALLGMLLTRSLHPPGGAVALTASLNPEMLDALGPSFVLVPVLCVTICLVCAAMVWHRLSGRVYPFRQPRDATEIPKSQPAKLRLGLEPEDLARILSDYRQSANLGVEDLARLIAAAEKVAADHSSSLMNQR